MFLLIYHVIVVIAADIMDCIASQRLLNNKAMKRRRETSPFEISFGNGAKQKYITSGSLQLNEQTNSEITNECEQAVKNTYCEGYNNSNILNKNGHEDMHTLHRKNSESITHHKNIPNDRYAWFGERNALLTQKQNKQEDVDTCRIENCYISTQNESE
ncbi:hypothetical protein THOM_2904 [Trachipleistophora hominis]|uniref:Uncharacterized protein n=1 Tax=Trachipleistophora hominis TaxID=72359 RepID=L7JT28_TRAHO|nr:hypothetical protein THOM_2904 [Trachipleistophora hominis]